MTVPDSPNPPVAPRTTWASLWEKPAPVARSGGMIAITPVEPGDGAAYATAALRNEAETVAGAANGTRNDVLNRSTFNLAQLVAAGHLTEDTVRDTLTHAARAAGLPDGEITSTINSGLRGGTKHPREVQPLPAIHTVTETTAAQITGLTLVRTETVAEPEVDRPDGVRPRTSWWPEQIVELADRTAHEPHPTHLIRGDGEALLYSGKVNTLIGESESGKSWIALHAVQQGLTQGQRCLFLDFEDSPATVRDRLRLLGSLDDDLARLDYAHPDQALDILAAADLQEALTHDYDVIVVDGVNYAMTLLGLDLNSNTDANIFNGKILGPLAATGACVIAVDHVPKNAEQRGKGAIGAQAKRAMVGGCSLRVEVVEPFGRGQDGTLKLWVDKDRTGHVRGISGSGKYAGKATVTSTDDAVRIDIQQAGEQTSDDHAVFVPTGVMESLSKVLEAASEPLGVNDARDLVGCKKETLGKAKTGLLAGGYIKVESGPRGAQMMVSVKAFRESDDERFPLVPTGSPPVPGTGQTTGSHPPPPRRGGNQSDPVAGTGQNPPLVPDETAPSGSDCGGCGKRTPDSVIKHTHGYCLACARTRDGA